MTTLSSKIKDWSIKGFQLQKTYLDDWAEMKHIFSLYGLDINIHGPILTLAEVKNVKYAKITCNAIAENLSVVNKQELFIIILRTFTKYARIMAEKPFFPFIKENVHVLNKVARNGTLKSSDEDLELKVRDLINGK